MTRSSSRPAAPTTGAKRRSPEPERPADRGIVRARTIARVMDDAYVDPLLGLLAPGVGDLVSLSFGGYLVLAAVRRRLPPVVIARMLINLAVDTLIGAIPIAGDAFDFIYKANQRNLELLDRRYRSRRASAGDWLFVIVAAMCVLAAVALPIYLTVRLLAWLF